MKGRKKRVITIVLGGGRGTRLFPLTAGRAKPAVPFGGKYRLIDIPLSNSINSGYRWIYVLTQYASDSLIGHIHDTFFFGPFVKGRIQVLAAQQTMERAAWYMGTADAVRRNMPRFNAGRPDHFLILGGDHLYRMDYRKFVEFHEDGNWDITIGVTPVRRDMAAEFGIMQVDARGQITDFAEKPTEPETIDGFVMDPSTREAFALDDPARCLAGSMGVYVFKPEILNELIEARPAMNDFGGEFIPRALAKYRLGGYLFKGYWEDLGTIGAYYRASLDLVKPNAFSFNDPEFPIYTHRRYLEASKIRHAEIDSSLVSEGATIVGSRISGSSIGIRSVIGPDTEIIDSIVMGNDYYEAEQAERNQTPLGIGAGSRLRNVIVDKNVRIGEACSLLNEDEHESFDGENFYIRDGIIVIPKDTVLPPRTRI